MTNIDTLLGGRPVDPGHLDSLGKQAARLSETAGITLTHAVVETLGHEKLNSEQVRRVVETANIEAFNTKFAATTGSHRVVHFEGGPADPSQVMQSLNDAARPQEVVVDSLDYAMPPDLVKSSSLVDYAVDSDRTRKSVVSDIYALHSKLSAAHEELVQGVEASKERLSDTFLDLAEKVKSATAAGATPEEIYALWFGRNAEVAKVAFARLSSLMQSHIKVAGREISGSSKLASAFDAMARESESLRGHVEALQRVEVELSRVSAWLQREGG